MQVWLLFSSMDLIISLETVLANFPFTVLISTLPITPGGIGVRESAYAYVFQPYSDVHISIAVGLFYYLFSTGFLALLGSLFVYIFLDKKIIKSEGFNTSDL